MERNISPGDRIARIVFGIGGLSTAFTDLQSPWFYLGIILWLTAIAGWCPLYSLFRISPGKHCK